MDEAASGAAGGGGDDGAVAILKKRTDSWPGVNASEAARYTCCRINKTTDTFLPLVKWCRNIIPLVDNTFLPET